MILTIIWCDCGQTGKALIDRQQTENITPLLETEMFINSTAHQQVIWTREYSKPGQILGVVFCHRVNQRIHSWNVLWRKSCFHHSDLKHFQKEYMVIVIIDALYLPRHVKVTFSLWWNFYLFIFLRDFSYDETWNLINILSLGTQVKNTVLEEIKHAKRKPRISHCSFQEGLHLLNLAL